MGENQSVATLLRNIKKPRSWLALDIPRLTKDPGGLQPIILIRNCIKRELSHFCF
jgi:hypothetical protein